MSPPQTMASSECFRGISLDVLKADFFCVFRVPENMVGKTTHLFFFNGKIRKPVSQAKKIRSFADPVCFLKILRSSFGDQQAWNTTCHAIPYHGITVKYIESTNGLKMINIEFTRL